MLTDTFCRGLVLCPGLPYSRLQENKKNPVLPMKDCVPNKVKQREGTPWRSLLRHTSAGRGLVPICVS
jgi:hypothetical protein